MKKLQLNKSIYFTVAIAILCLIQFIFIYKGIENTPFFNFGMFTEASEKKNKIYFVEVDLHEINLSKSKIYNSNILLYQLENLEAILANEPRLNQVIHSRCNALQLNSSELYIRSAITNTASKQTYIDWIKTYVRKDYPQAKQIDFGYHIIDENLTVLSTHYLSKGVHEGN
ncbi:MAG: hypothetical protein WCP57_05920 [Bacteroidota bacterium]